MESAHTRDVAGRYARFADAEARHHSDTYELWARELSRDPEARRIVESLPADRRQPNIVFACARLLGAEPGPYENLRRVLDERADDLAREVSRRSTQTNEPARLGVLLPVLAHLSQLHDGAPLALLELGASAGLCLWPERWSYRYLDRDRRVLASLDGDTPGHPPVGVLEVVVKEPLHRGGVTLPDALPAIAHRAGIDLNPLQASDHEHCAWLDTLVWPGQEDRRRRLDAALADAREHPAVVARGDLRDPGVLDALLAAVPSGSVPVVFHTAVLAYLDDADRARVEDDLLRRVAAGSCHWVANEGQSVLPGAARRIADDAGLTRDLRKGSFVVQLDGRPLYQADGHAGWVLG